LNAFTRFRGEKSRRSLENLPDLYDSGLPDGKISDKNPNLGKFCRVLQWKILVYVMDIWFILQPLGVIYGHLYILLQFFKILSIYFSQVHTMTTHIKV
jgi:hypothetical protein